MAPPGVLHTCEGLCRVLPGMRDFSLSPEMGMEEQGFSDFLLPVCYGRIWKPAWVAWDPQPLITCPLSVEFKHTMLILFHLTSFRVRAGGLLLETTVSSYLISNVSWWLDSALLRGSDKRVFFPRRAGDSMR